MKLFSCLLEDLLLITGHHQLCMTIKLRGLSPRANYTDRAAAAGRES